MLEEVLKETLGISREEEVLVVCDSLSYGVGEIIREAAEKLSNEVVVLSMHPRVTHGEEPPKLVARAMRASDVVIAPTTKSLSHTEARREACEAGTRVATLPAITDEMLTSGAMLADYAEVREMAEFLAGKLCRGKRIEIKTALGTDFTASLEGREALADSGYLRKRGAFGNLPAGEAFVAPLEGTAKGRVVVDASMGNLDKLSEPLKLEVGEGRVVSTSSRKLDELLSGVENSEVIAEVGIGCNPNARVTGHPLEDEKAFRTAHIALGDNHTFGGRNRCSLHIDGIFLNPSVWVDEEKLMEKGEFLCFQ